MKRVSDALYEVEPPSLLQHFDPAALEAVDGYPGYWQSFDIAPISQVFFGGCDRLINVLRPPMPRSLFGIRSVRACWSGSYGRRDLHREQRSHVAHESEEFHRRIPKQALNCFQTDLAASVAQPQVPTRIPHNAGVRNRREQGHKLIVTQRVGPTNASLFCMPSLPPTLFVARLPSYSMVQLIDSFRMRGRTPRPLCLDHVLFYLLRLFVQNGNARCLDRVVSVGHEDSHGSWVNVHGIIELKVE